ncbi:hypothetical protein FOA52_013705 [Chlamydomonas sp. UWO 241]|nr:hypothetical protein FOA52_013705 [Chlamydomonas sp. UWO 241]
MSGGDTSGLATAEGWTIAVLLLFLVSISLGFELILHMLTAYFMSRRKHAMVRLLDHVRNELLLVGFVSLFLSVFGPPLAKICYATGDPYSSSTYGSPPPPPAVGTSPEPVRLFVRRLLAGGGVSPCGPGQAQLWPLGMQHETHIFLFCVALTHITYTSAALLLSKMVVSRWAAWEIRCQEYPTPFALGQESTDSGRQPFRLRLQARMQACGSPTMRWLLAFAICLCGIPFEWYRNVRALLVADLPLGPNPSSVDDDLKDFNMHAFLVDTLEAEVADIVKADWWLWLLGIAMLAAPKAVDSLVWIGAICAAISLFCASVELVFCVSHMYDRAPLRVRLAHEEHSNLHYEVQEEPGPFGRHCGKALGWCLALAGTGDDVDESTRSLGMSAGRDAREQKREILRDEFDNERLLDEALHYGRRMESVRVEAALTRNCNRRPKFLDVDQLDVLCGSPSHGGGGSEFDAEAVASGAHNHGAPRASTDSAAPGAQRHGATGARDLGSPRAPRTWPDSAANSAREDPVRARDPGATRAPQASNDANAAPVSVEADRASEDVTAYERRNADAHAQTLARTSTHATVDRTGPVVRGGARYSMTVPAPTGGARIAAGISRMSPAPAGGARFSGVSFGMQAPSAESTHTNDGAATRAVSFAPPTSECVPRASPFAPFASTSIISETNHQDATTGCLGATLEYAQCKRSCCGGQTTSESHGPPGGKGDEGEEAHKSGWTHCYSHFLQMMFWSDRDYSLRISVMRFKTEYLQPLAHDDASDRLWFRSLQFVVRLLQIVFFENAVNLALCAFALYTTETDGIPDDEQKIVSSSALAGAMIGLDIVLLVYSAAILLPILALVAPASSHCQPSIVRNLINDLKIKADLDAAGEGVENDLVALQHMRSDIGRGSKSVRGMQRAPTLRSLLTMQRVATRRHESRVDRRPTHAGTPTQAHPQTALSSGGADAGSSGSAALSTPLRTLDGNGGDSSGGALSNVEAPKA